MNMDANEDGHRLFCNKVTKNSCIPIISPIHYLRLIIIESGVKHHKPYLMIYEYRALDYKNKKM